ncbi:glutamyl-tRNA reductase [Saccharothrix sp. NRRL B-16348]|uniref:glutamyl-tRNA reductase n=1 Tax=Saccharothrix sp. NRRL B-16348 TaxID=1415542 RepID=UPI0006AF08B8|nr:glutamyl-tRNA reductase [Saccharothrix sp. NRRL B-16348]KOX33835.1 glutamyl-tRNA reductase [Saccharothrix sp. NRRL B-16348]
MSVLVVGLSHRTTPVPVLERVAVADADRGKVLDQLLTAPSVSEAVLLSTCNRVEVYAVVETFHGGMNEVVEVLARQAGAEPADLFEHLYVHYSAAAVEHLFSVAGGLDSMVVGEAQILGQLRNAYNAADEQGVVGRTLHELVQHALRVGKRVHTETDIDHAGASVVSEALADAAAALGGLEGRTAMIVGAGSMGGLAAAHLRRAGIGDVVIANRTPANGERLATALRADGVRATSTGLDGLADEIAKADVLFACTGSVGTVVGAEHIGDRAPDRPLVVCDLGLPKDVDPAATLLDGVRVVDLETLQRRLSDAPTGQGTLRAAEIVAEEVRAYLAGQRSAGVTPTVTALRKRAAEVVDAELLRLDSRLPELPAPVRDELAKTVRRVVDKLLHTPTVRVKELAAAPGGAGYAEALRELFGLDPQAPSAVSTPHSTQPKGEKR